MKQIAFLTENRVLLDKKHLSRKMIAVASLAHVWVVVDQKLTTQRQRSPKFKISHTFFSSVFNSSGLSLINNLTSILVHDFYSVTTV